LWSLTTYSDKTTRTNLAARAGGDPAWMKCKITCGCVAGAAHEGPQSKAATRLLDALVRARVPYQFPRPPYLPGLLASNELSDIARAVIDELKHNALAAKATQQHQKAQIVEVASELGLNPRPAGQNDSAWIADCPGRSHTLTERVRLWTLPPQGRCCRACSICRVRKIFAAGCVMPQHRDDVPKASPPTHRRDFLIGVTASLLCAPAIGRASSLMPVKVVEWTPLALPSVRNPMLAGSSAWPIG
jgi:hypothetical protein